MWLTHLARRRSNLFPFYQNVVNDVGTQISKTFNSCICGKLYLSHHNCPIGLLRGTFVAFKRQPILLLLLLFFKSTQSSHFDLVWNGLTSGSVVVMYTSLVINKAMKQSTVWRSSFLIDFAQFRVAFYPLNTVQDENADNDGVDIAVVVTVCVSLSLIPITGKTYYFNRHTRQSCWELPADPKMQVKCSHLLVKHAQSRRPSSWRESNITRSKEEALAILQGAFAGFPCRPPTHILVVRLLIYRLCYIVSVSLTSRRLQKADRRRSGCVWEAGHRVQRLRLGPVRRGLGFLRSGTDAKTVRGGLFRTEGRRNFGSRLDGLWRAFDQTHRVINPAPIVFRTTEVQIQFSCLYFDFLRLIVCSRLGSLK